MGSNFPVQLAPYVNSCFYFGRTYAGTRNIESAAFPDGFQKSLSVVAGSPEDENATINATTGNSYMAPSEVANDMDVGGGEWDNVQFYKLVGTGSNNAGGSGCFGTGCTTNGDGNSEVVARVVQLQRCR